MTFDYEKYKRESDQRARDFDRLTNSFLYPMLGFMLVVSAGGFLLIGACILEWIGLAPWIK